MPVGFTPAAPFQRSPDFTGAPMVMPDLRQLRCLVAVARHRSFTCAAKDLNVAQQAISQQIKALEHASGVTLV